MRALIIPFLSFLFLLPSANTRARIIHVPADSSCIQCAINGAIDGDTVLVARGHYYERINFLGKAILVASNFIFDNDTTTIDSTIIDADTLVLGIGDTGSVVIFCNGEDSTSVLQGFTIQNGSGTFHHPYYYGCGIYCCFSSPKIIHNIIRSNQVSDENHLGGGIASIYNSFPTISENVITDNISYVGGGIYCAFGSDATITENLVNSNSVIHEGGGIHCQRASPLIANNIVVENQAFCAAGIFVYRCSSLISHNIVRGNWATRSGAGIFVEEAEPTVEGNLIYENVAPDKAGGIYCWGSPLIINNVIDRNSAGTFGGGMFVGGLNKRPVIKNNIISNSLDGVGIYRYGSSKPTILYNDVWNKLDGDFFNCPPGVGDTTWGTNFNGTPCDSFYNIIRDPFFADTINFELLCSSPCIDAGDPSVYVPIDSGGCRIDMGTHEYPYILGDANSDSSINIADVVFAVNYLFINGPAPCPYHAADTNCDGLVDIADIVCLINYLFLEGPLPCGF
jgi:hypothetical protein